ncbi:MAG TPA: hypothetical protein PKE30_05545 [Niabella sp.]|nr:hypothetical protein [Niabella sp.]
MSYWKLNDDESQGYYQPVTNSTHYKQGGQLVAGLFFFITSLFKLAGAIVLVLYAIIYMITRWLLKLAKNKPTH